MRYLVVVEVQGLDGIADPQGRTIERALPAVGFDGVRDVRVGKVIRFTLEGENEMAVRSVVEQMCERLLANPVIEQSSIRIEALIESLNDQR